MVIFHQSEVCGESFLKDGISSGEPDPGEKRIRKRSGFRKGTGKHTDRPVREESLKWFMSSQERRVVADTAGSYPDYCPRKLCFPCRCVPRELCGDRNPASRLEPPAGCPPSAVQEVQSRSARRSFSNDEFLQLYRFSRGLPPKSM